MDENRPNQGTLFTNYVKSPRGSGGSGETLLVEETRVGTFVILYEDGKGLEAQIAIITGSVGQAVTRAATSAPGLLIRLRLHPARPARNGTGEVV